MRSSLIYSLLAIIGTSFSIGCQAYSTKAPISLITHYKKDTTLNIVNNGKVLTIHLIGDSTVDSYDDSFFPLTGWGQKLGDYFDASRFRIDNAAESGRSSKSFLDEGRWIPVYNILNPGDFVLIQFGHNDAIVKDTLRHTDPYTTYKEYLKRYVNDSRAKGAIPILCTPICRNIWELKLVKNSLGDYPDAVRELARELNVPLIDLTYKTKSMMEAMGKDSMNTIFMILKTGLYKAWPDGRNDNTHLQEFGAKKVALLVFKSLNELGLFSDLK